MDTVWAAVGDDPLGEVIEVLIAALDGTVPGLDARVAADALIGAFVADYRCEQSGDAEILERIGYHGGNALEILVAAGAVPSADVLPAGLTILSALARLCLSDSASVLLRATLDILDDEETLADLRQSREDFAAGDTFEPGRWAPS